MVWLLLVEKCWVRLCKKFCWVRLVGKIRWPGVHSVLHNSSCAVPWFKISSQLNSSSFSLLPPIPTLPPKRQTPEKMKLCLQAECAAPLKCEIKAQETGSPPASSTFLQHFFSPPVSVLPGWTSRFALQRQTGFLIFLRFKFLALERGKKKKKSAWEPERDVPSCVICSFRKSQNLLATLGPLRGRKYAVSKERNTGVYLFLSFCSYFLGTGPGIQPAAGRRNQHRNHQG